VQLAIIYHSGRVSDPPRTRDALAEWVRAHPGRFTFDVSFTGLTFLKSLLADFAGGPDSLNGPFNETLYNTASARLWEYLREIRPYLWRKGETFPEDVAQLHQLFANGEVDFTMSNNDGEVDNKVSQGILPDAARAYVLDTGTIRNSHYLGIPFNAPNVAGALVVADFLISPEAQWKKATPAVWGDGTVLATKRLPIEWQERFAAIEGRTRIPPRDELETKALREPVPQIMVRLHDEFRAKILENGR
jgi:putative spermidine/putrescine transport system substrate-binding protein